MGVYILTGFQVCVIDFKCQACGELLEFVCDLIL